MDIKAIVHAFRQRPTRQQPRLIAVRAAVRSGGVPAALELIEQHSR